MVVQQSLFDTGTLEQESALRVWYWDFETTLGSMRVYCTERGVRWLGFTDESLAEDAHPLAVAEASSITKEKTLLCSNVAAEIEQYLAGKRTIFSASLDVVGTSFQMSVWRELQRIHYGETISYSKQAERMNNLPAIRAIAAANGANPVAIIIPCHRVVGSNGKLVGYAGGLWRKQQLLDIERRHCGKPTELQLF